MDILGTKSRQNRNENISIKFRFAKVFPEKLSLFKTNEGFSFQVTKM